MRIPGVEQVAFAPTMVGAGVFGWVRGDFVQMWQPVPKAFPAREVLIWLCAAVSLACGAGLVWRRTAESAARLLFFCLLLCMIVFKLRFIFLAPLMEGAYQSNGENAVIVASAWVLYVRLAAGRDRRQLGFISGDAGLRAARVLYALAMIAFGLSHFFCPDPTGPLIPAWLPSHTGLAYITGGAYLAAGAAILTGILAKPAAILSTDGRVHVPGVVAARTGGHHHRLAMGRVHLFDRGGVGRSRVVSRCGLAFGPRTTSCCTVTRG